MADQKISQLTEKEELGANDLFVIVSGSQNYKVKGSALKTYSQDGLATVATSGSYTDSTTQEPVLLNYGDIPSSGWK